MTRTRENRVRRYANRLGYRVIKSRGREFMLMDEENSVVLGPRFDASLGDIESFLSATLRLQRSTP